MFVRVLAAACLLMVSSAVFARATAAGDPASAAERATANAERIPDAEAFLDELETTVKLAQSGGYGPLGRAKMARLDSASIRINALLKGHSSAMELDPKDRLALYNAQETITATLNSDDKSRTICRRSAATGSRLWKTECMTVAEREARARASRESASRLQRTSVCYAGEGNSC
jgi:hypothetical protein